MELRLAVIIATLYVVLSRNVTGRTALFLYTNACS